MDQLFGYEGFYTISRNGVVKNRKGYTMKPQVDYKGYLYIRLYKNKVSKNVKLHRLLAIQYIPNHYNKPQVDHIDRNKQNNNLDNLRWATPSENGLNRGNRTDNISGVKNIHYSKTEGGLKKWNFKKIDLHSFDEPELWFDNPHENRINTKIILEIQ